MICPECKQVVHRIPLGATVRDILTGYIGVAGTRIEYTSGLVLITVQVGPRQGHHEFRQIDFAEDRLEMLYAETEAKE